MTDQLLRLNNDDDRANALLSAKKLARILDIEPKPLANWRVLGKGPRFFRLGDKHGPVRYLTVDVEFWLEKRAKTSTSTNVGGLHV